VAIVFGEYELLAKSGLFDAEYYARANPDIAALNVDPLMHYLERGCHERRNPSESFDTPHYLSQCEALGETPANALVHYLTVGVNRGLTPKPGAEPNGRPGELVPATRTARSAEPEFADASGKDAHNPAASLKPSRNPSKGAQAAASTFNGGREMIAANGESNVTVAPFPGYVDIFGYSSAAGGWLFTGWVARPYRTDQSEPVDFIAKYEQSQNKGSATLAFYQRGDLDQKSIGVIAFLPSSSRVLGNLQYVAFCLDGVQYQAQSGHSTERLIDQELVDRVRPNLVNLAFANRNRLHLLSITSRRGFTGQDTLSALSEPVLLEIDEAFACPPAGVLLKGWHLASPETVRCIRVRSGPLSGELVLSDSIRIDRPDVIVAVGPKYGFSEVHCGFIAYVAGAVSSGDVIYIEVELQNGEVGFKNFKISKRSGIDAIRRILEGIEVRYGDVDPAFDKVLGPAIASINAARLQEPAAAAEIEFGQAPNSPKCTLIIPLYGRVDFVEYQLAFFSRHGSVRQLEIIYVLDDPTKRRELETLAESLFERFRIPFRLLLLSTNLGFGPANNVGLRAARGQFICFLNSDIFPITEDWLERLVDRLEQNPDIGIVAAQLLFEDGSIQHEGCFYRGIAQFGNWTFIEHFNKGRRPSDTRGLQHCDVITGACLVMSRALALALKGFDESFIVGDFEDSDLCLRVKQRGLSCAVDHDVQLYHLERKSQVAPGQSWRMNLTLYNAWVHQRRWFDVPSSPGAARG
jgi:GT2 family glycosyltransferase